MQDRQRIGRRMLFGVLFVVAPSRLKLFAGDHGRHAEPFAMIGARFGHQAIKGRARSFALGVLLEQRLVIPAAPPFDRRSNFAGEPFPQSTVDDVESSVQK